MLDLKNNEEHVYIKYSLKFLFINGDTCVEKSSDWRESLCTQRVHWKSELPAGSASTPEFLTFYSLITPIRPHAILVSHLSQATPIQHLPFVGCSPHPRDACLSLATAHTHAMLALHGPHFTSMQYLFPKSFC